MREPGVSAYDLSITAPDGARVKVDGKDAGIAPLKAPVDVVVGLHGIDSESGGTAMHESVQAGAGRLTEVAFVTGVVGETKVVVAPVAVVPLPAVGGGNVAEPMKPVPYWNGRRTVGLIITGVGAAGMVVGGVFGAKRGGETTDAKNALGGAEMASGPSVSASHVCTNPPAAGVRSCAALSSARDSLKNDANAEDVLLVGGGVLVAVGLITTLWPNGAPAAVTSLAPTTGPHMAGLQWAGSF